MGFLGKVNNEIQDAANETWVVIKDGARIGNLKLRLYTLQKSSRRLFADIGALVYAASNTPWDNPLSQPEILRLIADAGRLEAEAKLLMAEISEIRQKPATSNAAPKKDR